jgi:hypothetical protein
MRGVGDRFGSRVVEREALGKTRDLEQAPHRPFGRYDEQSFPYSLELASASEYGPEGSRVDELDLVEVQDHRVAIPRDGHGEESAHVVIRGQIQLAGSDDEVTARHGLVFKCEGHHPAKSAARRPLLLGNRAGSRQPRMISLVSVDGMASARVFSRDSRLLTTTGHFEGDDAMHDRRFAAAVGTAVGKGWARTHNSLRSSEAE